MSTSFLDVVKNYGDFGAKPMQFGSGVTREASLVGAAESMGAWGGNSHQDREPGMRNISQVRVSDVARQAIYKAKLHEAQKLVLKAFTGSRRDMFNFQEAMSTSDFPNLFGDVIDRAVLANYLETPYTWNLIAKESAVNDFRPVKRFRVDGGTGLLSSTDANGQLIPLNQGAQYPEDSLSDGVYTYRLNKYGKRMPFFWETLVDDDLNAIKDTPARFGRGARRSEEYFVTQLFANGVNAITQNGVSVPALYSNTNKNIVNNANVGDSGGNNPILSITALQRAIIVLMKQLDTTGQPISVEAMTLVVPPSLKTVAMNILNTDYIYMADQGGTQQINGANLSATVAQQLHAMNWAKNIVRLAVNYYLPICDTTFGNTAWYLFSEPPRNGLPALEFGKLLAATPTPSYL